MSWEAPTGQMPRPTPLAITAVTPSPTAEEVAAIAVAMLSLWPHPVAAPAHGSQPDEVAAWRFSGRWWARPLPARRARPWR